MNNEIKKEPSELVKRLEALTKENEALKNQLSSSSDNDLGVPYQTLAENSNDGIVIVENNIIRYANKGLLKLMQYSKEEIVGKEYSVFFVDEDQERIKYYNIKRLLCRDVPTLYEAMLKKKDGSIVIVEVNAAVIQYEGRPAAIGSVRDVTERVNLRENIVEKEKELSFVLNVISDGYWDWDIPNNVISFNDKFKTITGYDIDNIHDPLNSELFFLYEEGKERFGKNTSDFLLRKRNAFSEEFRLKTADGHDAWVIVRGRVYKKDEIGNPIRIVGTFTDITSLKLAEKKQDEHLIFLNTLLDTISNPVFYKDADGIYTGGNQAFVDFVGVPLSKLIGSSVYDIAPRELADIYFKSDQEILRTKKTQMYEARVQNMDGDLRDVIFYKNVFYTPNGELGGIIGVVFDITDRKKISEELLKKNQFLESLLRKLPVVLFCVNNDGVFTLSEGLGLEAFGLKPGQIVGLSVYDIYKDQPVVIESFNRALNGEISYDKGNYKGNYYETYYSPFIGDDNLRHGIIGVSLNVTKKEEAQAKIQEYLVELQSTKDQLEKYAKEVVEKNLELENSKKVLMELNESKDRFFSVISHDLRSPFMSLIGLTDLLSHDYHYMEEHEVEEAIGSINRNTRNIFSLLENLLEWAKIQMGRSEIVFDNINVLEAVNTIIKIYKVNIEDKDIRVETNIDEKMIVVFDLNVLNTAFRNIISNAIKFTERGGVITIDASCNRKECKLIIRDSGIGIEPEMLKKLFSHNSMVTKPGIQGERGSGLGLLLSKELLEKAGGQIEVESEVGKGTVFTIYLPNIKNSD